MTFSHNFSRNLIILINLFNLHYDCVVLRAALTIMNQVKERESKRETHFTWFSNMSTSMREKRLLLLLLSYVHWYKTLVFILTLIVQRMRKKISFNSCHAATLGVSCRDMELIVCFHVSARCHQYIII